MKAKAPEEQSDAEHYRGNVDSFNGKVHDDSSVSIGRSESEFGPCMRVGKKVPPDTVSLGHIVLICMAELFPMLVYLPIFLLRHREIADRTFRF